MPLFLVTMTVPLIFPFLTEPRRQLAPVLLPLLIGGLVWAIHRFRSENQDRTEREVVRLRESLRQEIRDLLVQALKDWQTRADRVYREVEKNVAREVEERCTARGIDQGRQAVLERGVPKQAAAS